MIDDHGNATDARRRRHSASPETTGSAPTAEFQALFMERFAAMISLARLTGSDDPEDTAQEAFVRLHAKWHSLRNPAAARGYLHRTVVNLSHNRTRHLSVVRDHLARESTKAPESMSSAEADVMAADSSRAMQAALAQLPVKQRAAIALRYYLDMPFGEIATALDCPSSTARSHVRRGLLALGKILDAGAATSASACENGDTA